MDLNSLVFPAPAPTYTQCLTNSAELIYLPKRQISDSESVLDFSGALEGIIYIPCLWVQHKALPNQSNFSTTEQA